MLYGLTFKYFYKHRVVVSIFKGIEQKKWNFFKKGRAAALTDCTERKNVFLTFYKCRFSIKWPDNNGLYERDPTFRKFLSHLRQAAILNEPKTDHR